MAVNEDAKHVIVVGGGIVGLSTAWFLKQKGLEVTILERDRVGGPQAASWGNAGWVAPAFSVPLAEPAAFKLGISTFLSKSSPVYIPPRPDPNLVRFLLCFVRNCTSGRWTDSLKNLTPLNRRALPAHQELQSAGVDKGPARMDPGLILSTDEAARAAILHELETVKSLGLEVGYRTLSGTDARALAPSLGPSVEAAIELDDQYYVDPRPYIDSLRDRLIEAGVTITENTEVKEIMTAATPRIRTSASELAADAVVMANGAWLQKFGRQLGIKQTVQAGRGYSFAVETDELPGGPLYFPAQRLVATPMSDKLRISGMMEFRRPDDPLDGDRIAGMVDAISPMLPGINFSRRTEEWVGSRPCTADGLPLIGASAMPGFYVAGGYGMWGLTLGPAGGKLLAEQITGVGVPPELVPLNPLR